MANTKLREDWAALKVLLSALGLLGTCRVVWRVEKAKRVGAPFQQLGIAVDEKESASRRQIQHAILLYQALRELYDEARALSISAKVIEASAHEFLTGIIGRIDEHELIQLTEPDRASYVLERLARIPNTEATLDYARADGVQFTVSRCHFVELCHRLRLPELAPLFCAVDESYFGQVQENVRLTRPTTLAKGGPNCRFQLEFSSTEGDDLGVTGR